MTKHNSTKSAKRPGLVATGSYDLEGAEFPSVSFLALDSIQSDGAFWCCGCYRENPIALYKGQNPFGVLKCLKCEHVPCQACFTTNVFEIMEIPAVASLNVDKYKALVEAPYGSLCRDCSRTYRACGKGDHFFSEYNNKVSFKLKCRCGNTASGLWGCFQIGSNQDWRLSPERCYAKAVDERAEKSLHTVKVYHPAPQDFYPEHGQLKVHNLSEQDRNGVRSSPHSPTGRHP